MSAPPNAYAAGLLDLEALRAERCRRDPAYFVDTYCRIQPREGGALVPFRLFPYQADLLAAFLAHPELIILKARQLGVTELVAAYCVWRALRPGFTAIIISQGETEAREFLRRARVIWEHLPDWLRVPALDEGKSSTLELVNGARILPFPATAKAGRSFTAQLLVLDEWAKQARQAEIYAAAKPTITGQIIGISTADGVGNFFHRQWQLAREGKGAHALFLPWHARPDRDASWYEAETRTYEPWQRAQEFPTDEHEAFILSGRPRFDQAALTAIAARAADPIETTALGDGALRVWEHPVPGRRYVCGADTAEGLPKGDYSAAVVLDWETGAEVAELHGHWEPEVFAAHLARLCTAHNHCLLGVERNNHGHAVLLALRTIERYPHLYRHVEYDKRRGETEGALGWQTSSKSKPIMIDHLATAIAEMGRGDRLPSYRNTLFVAEARTYAVLDNGDTGASGSLHDDRIIAYAIAEQLRRRPPTTGAAVYGGERATIKPFNPRGAAQLPGVITPHRPR